MKFFLMAALATMLLSSCLKESISDALLSSQNNSTNGGGSGSSGSGATAIMTYQVNGSTVTTSVAFPDQQVQLPGYIQLGCSKTLYPGTNNVIYSLDCLSSSGEMSFIFYTDSLKAGNYIYKGIDGDMYFMSYNNTDGYVHDALDNLSFNITSYSKGYINGNFSGRLTPLVMAGNPNNTYGTPGSVLITNGTFQNVPVFY